MAIIYGLKQFQQFLLGREEFIIRTDHSALTTLMNMPDPVGQQSRWLDLLAGYNFCIQHRAVTSHGNGNGLSRRPCDQDAVDKCPLCKKMYLDASCATVRSIWQDSNGRNADLSRIARNHRNADLDGRNVDHNGRIVDRNAYAREWWSSHRVFSTGNGPPPG